LESTDILAINDLSLRLKKKAEKGGKKNHKYLISASNENNCCTDLLELSGGNGSGVRRCVCNLWSCSLSQRTEGLIVVFGVHDMQHPGMLFYVLTSP